MFERCDSRRHSMPPSPSSPVAWVQCLVDASQTPQNRNDKASLSLRPSSSCYILIQLARAALCHFVCRAIVALPMCQSRKSGDTWDPDNVTFTCPGQPVNLPACCDPFSCHPGHGGGLPENPSAHVRSWGQCAPQIGCAANLKPRGGGQRQTPQCHEKQQHEERLQGRTK